MRNTTIMPKAPVGRILFRAGAKRVSQPAINTFADVLTGIAEEIATKAVQIAKHSGRKTVQDGDIKLAVK
jgi:histone H3/H4|tara:strand:- start:333 stop:542 length:210 start_codon:yes stop_codon:yes gene_type:complete